MMQAFDFIFMLLIFLSSLMVITSVNPIHSVFWLVLTFLESSCLLLYLKFDFIGLILTMIYVGAITILFLFVIMMLDIYQLSKGIHVFHVFPLLLLMFVYFLFSKVSYVEKCHWIQNWQIDSHSYLMSMSSVFYTDLVIPFLGLSLLLLIAMVGAIMLTLESGLLTKRQFLSYQHQSNNSWT